MFKLKPCPFCGSRNVYIAGTKRYWVVCANCGAEGPVPDGSIWDFKGPAVRAWNKRYNSNCRSVFIKI